jgi:hypothetical protein
MHVTREIIIFTITIFFGPSLKDIGTLSRGER